MNLAEFQICAERTMGLHTTSEERMVNAALGLAGEAAEVVEAFKSNTANKILAESGDYLWYVAQMCKAFGWSIADVPPYTSELTDEEAMYELIINSGKAADLIKKKIFHNREINTANLLGHLREGVDAIDVLLGFYGKTVEDACDYNNAKLLKRHPPEVGFTFEGANARADEA